MNYPKFRFSTVFICGLLAVCRVSAFSQSAATTPVFDGVTLASGRTTLLHDLVLSTDRKASHPIESMVSGSIKGRVFNDEGSTQEARATDTPGVAGVRVVLRSAESDGIQASQISDLSGRFDFTKLSPGKYVVELDPISIPSKFRASDLVNPAVDISVPGIYALDLSIVAKRSITGIVFIDNDGDAQYKAGRDEPVEGAVISVGGRLATSDAAGRYVLQDLPAGRIGLLARWPKKDESTQVVFNLDAGPVTNRVVNIPKTQ